MARSEARVSVDIWAPESDFTTLTIGAQLRYLFLLSQQDLAHTGMLALRERRWSRSAKGLTVEQVTAELEELEAARYLVIDHGAEEVLIRSYIRRDKVYRQPQVLRAAADQLSLITSPALRRALAVELRRIADEPMPEPSRAIVAEMLAALPNHGPQGAGHPPTDSTTPEPRPESGMRETADIPAGDGAHRHPAAHPAGEGAGEAARTGPGERGVVTAVTKDFPDPRSSDSDPRDPPAGAPRAGAGARDAAGPAAAPAQGPPPEKCSKHIDDPDPPPCGRCADARRAREQWDREQLLADAERRSREAKDRAIANAEAIARCQLCDSRGYLPSKRQCTHDPARTNGDGAAEARKAIPVRTRPPVRDTAPEPIAAAMARREEARQAHLANGTTPAEEPT
jgi:hypothetical protein